MSVSFKTIFRFIFAIFLFSVIFTPVVNTQAKSPIPGKTVVTIGTGKIYQGNTAKAKEAAIANGLVAAVENAALGLLPPESLAPNFQIFSQALDGKTRKFIQGYRVLAEFSFKDTYRVLVQTTVFISSLKTYLSDAGVLLSEKMLPKILVLISEQDSKDRSPKYWWSQRGSFNIINSGNSLITALKNKGFSVIEPQRISKKTMIGPLSDKPVLNDHEAIDLARKLQANVVIVGKSSAEKMPNIMGQNIRSFKGMVTAHALRTDTGEEIAATTQNAVTSNTSESAGSRDALTDAGLLAGKALASQIINAWQKEEKQYNTIEIVVEGTDNLSNFVKFQRMINQIPNAKNLQLQEMKIGESILKVEFQGDAKALADALMLQSLESVGINIYEVSPDHLKIELVPK